MKIFSLLASASLLGLSLTAPVAHAGDSLEQAFKEGTPTLFARYRYEYVSQDSVAEEAHASTLATRLGYITGDFYSFKAGLEFENIMQLGADNYNDTLNGRTDHPLVADVEDTAVNQAFLAYSGIPNTEVKLGRQSFTLDDHRFIGNVGWRQNDQTYDAVTVVNNSLPETTLTYGYIQNVNRIFGDDSPMGDFESNSHIAHIANQSTPLGTLAAYGHFLDFEQDSPALSSRTLGAFLDGKQALNDEVNFLYHLEYARQSDHGDNPTSYDADYYRIVPGLSWKGLTASVGYEVLGSDNGVAAFTTPLATLHKFNGWGDKFLTTPANGLEDIYLDISYKFSGLEGSAEMLNGLLVKAQYHDFSADNGGADYGTEWGVYTKLPFKKHYFVEAKYEEYDAETFSSDTERFIFGLGVKY